MRECYEETGLQITEDKIDTTKQYTEQYHCISHGQEVDKTVFYYTAKIPYTDVTQLSGYSEGDGEILGKKIVTIQEAIDIVTYDATRLVIQQVKETLDTKY